MKKLLYIVLFTALSTFSYAQQTWTQVWSDEFNYTGLPDSLKWGYDVGGGGFGNNEEQYYTDARIENAHVDQGMLTITAIKESFLSSEYTSTRLVSKNKGDWLYGKIEVRAQLPTGNGMWPAIWMLPTDNVYGGWPNSGEIDIMENVGFDPDKIHWNIHTEAYNHTIGTNKGASKTYVSPSSNFYTYSIEWYPDSLLFLVDDVKQFTFLNEHNTSAEWPFDQRMHLILNIAVGGTWGGSQGIDNNAFPQEMLIDYVRVSQLTNPNAATYQLTLPTTEGGSTFSNMPSGAINNGTNISLTAIPDAGYEFVSWIGTYSSGNNPINFDMLIDATMTPVFKKQGELLTNGNFNNSSSNWWYNDGGISTVNTSNGDINFNTPTQATNPWDIQLTQAEFLLISGHTYEFSFDAYSNQNTSFVASVGLNSSPWTTYVSNFPSLTTSSQTFTYSFTMNIDDPAARVVFDLGKALGDIHIDNVSLVDLSIISANDLDNYSTDIALFPNPITDKLSISNVEEIKAIRIINSNGKIVLSPSPSSQLNIQSLNKGIYTIQLLTKNGWVSKSIVKE